MTRHEGRGRRRPSAIDRTAFPAIEAFALGYLHEDFEVEHGSPEAALAAFIRDASAQEREALAREWRALRTRLSGRTASRRLEALASLGTAWRPKSWQAVIDLFDALDRELDARAAARRGK